jgi:hypothetical protein
MDQALNREPSISSQLRTNHWLSGEYLMRIGKRAHAECWFCEDRYVNIQPPTMTRTHVLICCPTFEAVRREVWNYPSTAAFTRPRSIGTLLRYPRWGMRLLKFLENMTIGKEEPDKIDNEIRRITRYEEWCTSWKIPSRRMMTQSATVATMKQERP